jgi:hypothetical protein
MIATCSLVALSCWPDGEGIGRVSAPFWWRCFWGASFWPGACVGCWMKPRGVRKTRRRRVLHSLSCLLFKSWVASRFAALGKGGWWNDGWRGWSRVPNVARYHHHLHLDRNTSPAARLRMRHRRVCPSRNSCVLGGMNWLRKGRPGDRETAEFNQSLANSSTMVSGL